MSVWFYTINGEAINWDGWIVLFDGENTYWSEEMRPSVGHPKLRYKTTYKGLGVFTYIGELE